MSNRILGPALGTLFALLALALPAFAQAASHNGAVVFSQVTEDEAGKLEGGLFAVRDQRLNQLTEDSGDAEPDFAADGRTIVFARGGDLFKVRPDGSGQLQLTRGPEIDSVPKISPSGKLVIFERRASEGAGTSLFSVRIGGGAAHPLTSTSGADSEASFSADGRTIVFVRTTVDSAGKVNHDLYTVHPDGHGITRLTATARVDEFAPRYFAGGIVFSRGNDSDTAAAYGDVFTMLGNGTKVRQQIGGGGSSYVEDVSPNGRVLLFRRDRGLWLKRIGHGNARLLYELPDGAKTTSIFSADGRKVAAIVATAGGTEVELVSIEVANGSSTQLASTVEGEEGSTKLGPTVTWQP